jgi:hypothetical protein
LSAGAREPERFLAHARSLARRSADDVHAFKLAAAAVEEAQLCGSWARPFACAALGVHLPSPGTADTERLQRIREALAVASR